MVQRLLLLTRPGPITAPWVANQWNLHRTWNEPSQHCGAQWAWNAQSMVKYVDPVDWELALASCLYKDYIMITASCWPSTPLKRSSGWRSEIRHSVPWEKPRRTGLQIVRCFQVKILWAQILASSPTQRNTKVANQFLGLVLLASPWATFLLLLIFAATYL